MYKSQKKTHVKDEIEQCTQGRWWEASILNMVVSCGRWAGWLVGRVGSVEINTHANRKPA